MHTGPHSTEGAPEALLIEWAARGARQKYNSKEP
jgi:hypothetical protein